jgi:hypothetical protein
MVEIKVRFPDDVLHAARLTAERRGTSVAEVIRTGTLSYVSFDAARAGDEASEALAELFEVAARAVAVWPI